jgi:hypothetical protein
MGCEIGRVIELAQGTRACDTERIKFPHPTRIYSAGSLRM